MSRRRGSRRPSLDDGSLPVQGPFFSSVDVGGATVVEALNGAPPRVIHPGAIADESIAAWRYPRRDCPMPRRPSSSPPSRRSPPPPRRVGDFAYDRERCRSPAAAAAPRRFPSRRRIPARASSPPPPRVARRRDRDAHRRVGCPGKGRKRHRGRGHVHGRGRHPRVHLLDGGHERHRRAGHHSGGHLIRRHSLHDIRRDGRVEGNARDALQVQAILLQMTRHVLARHALHVHELQDGLRHRVFDAR